ncbi:MAG: ribosome biogenesis GTP-binding protein YihA/YsxC [Pseudomonadota bacterium]
MTQPPSIHYQQAKFLISAEKFSQCTNDEGAEVAFAGRSNVGKSSVINALTRQTKLARVSKTPGRTQLINFFSLNEQQRLVDLPGYGYAKVPAAMRERWKKELNKYFERRESLRGLVIIMDIRHPLTPFDLSMIDYAETCQIPTQIILNKADKFKFGAAKSILLKVNQQLAARTLEYSIQLFSATKKTGMDELEAYLNDRLWVTDEIT